MSHVIIIVSIIIILVGLSVAMTRDMLDAKRRPGDF